MPNRATPRQNSTPDYLAGLAPGVRAALEACFWLPADADDAKMLKTFHDGVHRIHAVAHRKLLAHPSTRLELTTADFSRG